MALTINEDNEIVKGEAGGKTPVSPPAHSTFGRGSNEDRSINLKAFLPSSCFYSKDNGNATFPLIKSLIYPIQNF